MKTKVSKLLDVLQEKSFLEIPIYQRNYGWNRDLCDVFYNDVIQSKSKDEHFFGTIIYSLDKSSTNTKIIIDGQQRITTVCLFLLAVFHSSNNSYIKHKISNEHLFNNDLLKLKLLKDDYLIYQKIVSQSKILPKEQNTNIYKNYKFFYNKVINLSEDDYIRIITKDGLQNFNIIGIELDNTSKYENPQIIFESFNSYNKPLSFVDLIKNYLLSSFNIEKQQEYYKKYWLKIKNTLKTEENICSFVRCFCSLTSHLDTCNIDERNLYLNFKRLFREYSSLSILKELYKYSQLYSLILCLNKTKNTKINRLLSDLKTLDFIYGQSHLLFFLDKWKAEIITDDILIVVLETFRNYVLRRRVCGLNESPKFVKILSNSENVLNKNIKQKLIKVLSSQSYELRFPNNTEVRDKMLSLNFYNFKYCKFYLQLIEEKLSKNDVINKTCTIEHIMPQSLDKQNLWRKQLGSNYKDVHKKY